MVGLVFKKMTNRCITRSAIRADKWLYVYTIIQTREQFLLTRYIELKIELFHWKRADKLVKEASKSPQ